MPRVRLFHWKAPEASPFIELLRAAGHRVAYDEKIAPGLFSKIRKAPPDAVVIALNRLPSHGREVASFLRGSKTTRHIPIVFVGGDPAKVDAVRGLIPDAAYTSVERLIPTLQNVLAHPPAAPIVPPQMMERYRGRTAAQKLGIAKDTQVGLLDPSRFTLSSLLALLYLVVFGSLIAFNCFSYLVARVAAQKITTYALVNPVIALALGALVLGEKITPAALLAAALVLLGIALVLFPGLIERRGARGGTAMAELENR